MTQACPWILRVRSACDCVDSALAVVVASWRGASGRIRDSNTAREMCFDGELLVNYRVVIVDGVVPVGFTAMGLYHDID